MWFPFLFILILASVGDYLIPADLSSPTFEKPWLLNTFLYANLPLLLAGYVLFFARLSLWQEGSESFFSPFFLEARRATSAVDLIGGFLGLGLLFGIAATNVAHELVHRTWSPWAQGVGRCLLAFTWDGQFAIEHVYGHHRKVSTFEDPASARRGEGFYRFFVRSFSEGTASAWVIEKNFLSKKNRATWSLSNRLLLSWSVSLSLALLAGIMASWLGLLVHLALAVYGKAYLELVNYVEHYGLVRLPKTPVHRRHSWNSNAPISSWFLYNLPRHSHHHAVGHLPFWRLNPEADAPTLPFGYMTMIVLALNPRLFKKVMEPQLNAWDETFASEEEKAVYASAVKSFGLAQ